MNTEIKENKRKVKQKGYTRKYYYSHKEKVLAYAREYRQRPEVKERHRLKMAEWRKNNHDKFLEISRKSWKNNGAKHNEKRNLRYNTDPEFRKKKIESEKKYKATGRRKELRVKHAPLLRKRSAEWKKRNPEHVKKYVKGYRKSRQIHLERKQRAELADQYVIGVIKKSMDYKVKTEQIPKELIELERIKIKTIRSLKNSKK